MNKIDLQEKLSLINNHWNPRIAGELNGQQVKLVKFKGPFHWHHHEREDELFMVINGRFKMEYRDDSGKEQAIWIQGGEILLSLVDRSIGPLPKKNVMFCCLNLRRL